MNIEGVPAEDSAEYKILRGFLFDTLTELAEYSGNTLTFRAEADGETELTALYYGHSRRKVFLHSEPRIILGSGGLQKQPNTVCLTVTSDVPGLYPNLHDGLLMMSAGGSYTLIYERWQKLYRSAADVNISINLIIIVTLLIILLSAGLIIWSRILNRRVFDSQNEEPVNQQQNRTGP